MSTIFALSTGMPPAAISIVRISGPEAMAATESLAGPLPAAREARVRPLRDVATGELLDRAIVLVFPAPATATGEDLVELHLHGGRAVVASVEEALGGMANLRRAEPGEFTRRALANGRIDLAEAEGLGDLLTAETQMQRRAALQLADGILSRRVAAWRAQLIELSAEIEASLDFDDEADVPELLLNNIQARARTIGRQIGATLGAPTVERLRDGIRVVIAGPPNSGKSTLFNAMVQREAAIVSPLAGTTRDRIETTVARDGIAFVLTDTAGLRDHTDDVVERIGIERAGSAIADADIVIWLGDDPPEAETLWLQARADLPGRTALRSGQSFAISSTDPASIDRVWRELVERAHGFVPSPGDLALNQRQAGLCREAVVALGDIEEPDALVVAESLRGAYYALARVTGDTGVEAMLDALFSKFCIGK